MDEQTLRRQCLKMIESISASGDDAPYPVRKGTRAIILCGSAGGYVMSTDFGSKEYSDAEAVLKALVDVERMQGEEDPLEAVHSGLSHIC
ncbi:MAG: hypothetical protein AUJ49_06210 [Desulfovibrionaceae bacterium CG1_02_65_16]|nr:MAG: hypothetical protein AUJ49_06210 [Desulfovibrionaceae bacterium CG1_02_65_16]